MKKQLLLFSAVLLIQASVVSMFAQSKPKAGDKISGIVSDDVAPMWKVKVAEKDSSGKTVRKKVTNKNGEFSFRLVNPEDRIQVTYEMYDTVNLPIDKTYFDIKIKIQDEVLYPSQYIDGPYSGFEGMGRVNLEYVDLGLSVKWATCNVGADKPEDYGDYYAWGELEPKESYTWENYRYFDPSTEDSVSKYHIGEVTYQRYDNLGTYKEKEYISPDRNTKRFEPIDDAATTLWGSDWRIPTSAEYNELYLNCHYDTVTVNDVICIRYTSKIAGYEDRSILIPYGGYIEGSEHKELGLSCWMWTSAPQDEGFADAVSTSRSMNNDLARLRGEAITDSIGTTPLFYGQCRYKGLNIRAVRENVAGSTGSFELSKRDEALKYGEIKKVKALDKESYRPMESTLFTWSSSDPGVAVVSENGTVTATGLGSCYIMAEYDGQKAQMKVTVTVPSPEAVDLGLSVKWASANLGASQPHEAGAYLAWGETSPKDGLYTIERYKFGKSSNEYRKYNFGLVGHPYYPLDYKSTLEPEDDAATVMLGGGWRMPTADELWELQNRCEWKNIDRIDSCGYIITSKVPGFEGRSIFLPAAGYKDSYNLERSMNTVSGGGANYWTSTLGESLGGDSRCFGYTIRPVIDLPASAGKRKEIKPDPIKRLTHSAAVDLGLSVRWADCNVGADAPEDIGARIAWGETTVKTYYSRINYKHMKAYPSENRWWYSKYADKIDQWDGASFMDGKTRLEPEDDAAHVNWGGSWRMPTKEEYAELFEKCEWTETTRNGVKGYLITSKVPGYTSNSIFLPYTDSSSAIYMTSDLSSRRVNSCVTLRFSQYETGTSDDEVNLGIGWADHGGLLEGIRWAKIHIEPYLRFSGAFIRAVTK